MSESLPPRGVYIQSTIYTVHGIPQTKNTGVGSLPLLRGIFPTQASNLGLPHCRRILYQLTNREARPDLKVIFKCLLFNGNLRIIFIGRMEQDMGYSFPDQGQKAQCSQWKLSLNHWTSREASLLLSLFFFFLTNLTEG